MGTRPRAQWHEVEDDWRWPVDWADTVPGRLDWTGKPGELLTLFYFCFCFLVCILFLSNFKYQINFINAENIHEHFLNYFSGPQIVPTLFEHLNYL